MGYIIWWIPFFDKFAISLVFNSPRIKEFEFIECCEIVFSISHSMAELFMLFSFGWLWGPSYDGQGFIIWWVGVHHIMDRVHHMMDRVHHMMDRVHHMMDRGKKCWPHCTKCQPYHKKCWPQCAKCWPMCKMLAAPCKMLVAPCKISVLNVFQGPKEGAWGAPQHSWM